jgi:hypothetical protein
MVIDTALAVTGTQLGYARVSTTHQSLDQQMDALTAAGFDGSRVYTGNLSGTPPTPLGDIHMLAPAVTFSHTPGRWTDPILVPKGSSHPEWIKQ